MGHGNGTSGELKDSLYFWYKQWGQVSSTWPLIKGSIVFFEKDRIYVDLHAATLYFLANLRFPDFTGDIANARALHFEKITQRIINKTKWMPSPDLLQYRGRTLKYNGKNITDIDAIGELKGQLLLVSCKSIPYTNDYNMGDHKITRNISCRIEEAVVKWQEVIDFFNNNKKGDNYDFSNYLIGPPLVCTPVPFFSKGVATEIAIGSLRKACTLEELEEYLFK